jgi:hypothetical protein
MLRASTEQAERPRPEVERVNGRYSFDEAENGAQRRPVPVEATRSHSKAKDLLEMPGALLTRTHLRELGLERRAVDAVFRALPVVALPGYSRPLVRAEQYRELVDEFTYRDDRVRPMVHSP